ncbi:hypothetical protein COV15_03270 [Candidatus Woesearchaeota archaeon CG10_big_fil_rev_8_21_14_0_10_34_12]|nr:MAG: hypothetical protein COV15_03270 [Candidatus Woesearchaeota archaeon CG10_big_fil_rev_8_21_14_0_10_34_12]
MKFKFGEMINRKEALAVLILLVGIMINGYFVSAVNGNSTLADAEKCLSGAKDNMQELIDNGFNTERVSDVIKNAESVLNAQKALEELDKKSDYTLVLSYCREVGSIRSLAYESRDMLYSLEKTYEEFKSKTGKMGGINVSDIDSLVNEARQEVSDERYEKAIEKIPDFERQIIDREAEITTMNLFYSSVTRGLKEFVADNYLMILGVLVLALVFYVMYRARIKQSIILRKIKKLETEKEVLRDLIKKTQKDYFQYGKIPEGIYNIRTKRFAELIRDIDRQIPLLNEQLVKLNVQLKETIKKEEKLGRVEEFIHREKKVQRAKRNSKKLRKKR